MASFIMFDGAPDLSSNLQGLRVACANDPKPLRDIHRAHTGPINEFI